MPIRHCRLKEVLTPYLWHLLAGQLLVQLLRLTRVTVEHLKLSFYLEVR